MKTNYRLQESCMTCKFSFCKNEYDGCPEYYCTVDGVKRPPCGSVLMNEDWNPTCISEKDFEKGLEKWLKWVKGREVAWTGICDEWIK